MTEDELKAFEFRDKYCVDTAHEDRTRLIAAVRSLTTQLAVAQGTATAETHRADERQARVEVLEKEAMEQARTMKEATEGYWMVTSRLVTERDALKALVESATAFRFGMFIAEPKEDDTDGWWCVLEESTDGEGMFVRMNGSRDEAIAKARDMAKVST